MGKEWWVGGPLCEILSTPTAVVVLFVIVGALVVLRRLPSWCCIAQFAVTINSNVCPQIRVPNMLMRESYA